jgi:hypothetical protein
MVLNAEILQHVKFGKVTHYNVTAIVCATKFVSQKKMVTKQSYEIKFSKVNVERIWI